MHAKGARQCLGYKSNASFTLFAGDSTTRDLFYEVASMLGVPLVGAAWTGKDRRPSMPYSSLGRDKLGWCMGDSTLKKKCVRHLTFSNRHRVGFLFLDGGNATYETHLIRDVPTTVVLQCPIYHFYKPHAYDYTRSASDRARVNASGFSIDAYLAQCEHYISYWKARGSRIVLMGLTPMPSWARKTSTFERDVINGHA